MARIAVVPGDGVGHEVMSLALSVLQVVVRRFELELVFTHFGWGADYYLQTGIGLPEGGVKQLGENFDSILFGAVGDPRIPSQVHAREILLGLRFGLDLFINLRPCTL